MLVAVGAGRGVNVGSVRGVWVATKVWLGVTGTGEAMLVDSGRGVRVATTTIVLVG